MKVVEYLYKKDTYVETEEAMFTSLECHGNISDQWTLHKLPFSTLINSLGIYGTQQVIGRLNKEEKKIVVCQHVQVGKLRFDPNTIVCTPHTSYQDQYVSIPHAPVNIGSHDMVPKKLFGFMGSTTTHKTRKQLVKLYPDHCISTNVHWGLERMSDQDFVNRYIENLGSIHFSICPRGTGISSVRLFESMAMGCIPVIIADGYRPPLDEVINWNKCSVRIPENSIKDLMPMLTEFSEVDIAMFKENVKDVYTNYLSNTNFYKSLELSRYFKR